MEQTEVIHLNNGQCGSCQLIGNLEKCEETPCPQHDSWYAKIKEGQCDELQFTVRTHKETIKKLETTIRQLTVDDLVLKGLQLSYSTLSERIKILEDADLFPDLEELDEKLKGEN